MDGVNDANASISDVLPHADMWLPVCPTVHQKSHVRSLICSFFIDVLKRMYKMDRKTVVYMVNMSFKLTAATILNTCNTVKLKVQLKTLQYFYLF